MKIGKRLIGEGGSEGVGVLVRGDNVYSVLERKCLRIGKKGKEEGEKEGRKVLWISDHTV